MMGHEDARVDSINVKGMLLVLALGALTLAAALFILAYVVINWRLLI